MIDVNSFKNILENYGKYLKEVKTTRQELKDIFYLMTGVSGVRYDKLPSSYNPELSEERKLELIDKYNEKKLELCFLLVSIKFIRTKLSKLSEEDKKACLEIIVEGVTNEKAGKKRGYSHSGMWSKVNRSLEKILK